MKPGLFAVVSSSVGFSVSGSFVVVGFVVVGLVVVGLCCCGRVVFGIWFSSTSKIEVVVSGFDTNSVIWLGLLVVDSSSSFLVVEDGTGNVVFGGNSDKGKELQVEHNYLSAKIPPATLLVYKSK